MRKYETDKERIAARRASSKRYRLNHPEKRAAICRAWKRKANYCSKEGRRYRLKYPGKLRAHRWIKNALRYGHIVRPDKCSNCGKSCKPHAHHPDYRKKRLIVWLCRPCHLEQHERTARIRIQGDPL